ncbi:helix-turn-helix domain-containing protein [Candidatus Mycobacterium wuenschmannii]|uniref:Helix-turn-helix domain-containing protein n=1 Tax=Candidatus Mycobacterium wuenschmannii TaxID=3027808 RepID=A0ABY8VSM3_9MYCO|nr:helix-turn-helix domain-containing protein [Candidatus Mycobacterium wuenschmannii]WIM85941.1 helix-turn-helix domain-containing protein [Candidatus Mycobacterium wuenschmannii]
MTDPLSGRGGAADDVADMLGGLGGLVRELPESIHRLLVDEVPELTADQQLTELLNDTVAANVDTWFSAIRYSIPIDNVEPPTAALEHARRMAQRDIPVNALLRAYRLGHQHGLNLIISELRRADLAPDQKLELYEHITHVSFRYIDWMSEQVLATYQAERQQWDENRRSLRTQAIRDILDGRDVDVSQTSKTMDYPLDATHLALLVWLTQDTSSDADAVIVLERFARQAVAAAGATRLIYHSIDRLVACVWMTMPEGSDAIAKLRSFVLAQTDSPKVTVGEHLCGVEGFRRSYQQAAQARAVTMAGESPKHRFVATQDPGLALASMLVVDIPTLKYWIHTVLGTLAQSNDTDHRLRETLRVFLRAGSSYKAAAEELQIHTNTVKYRVSRAVARRGQPVAASRLDLEVALLMCDWFGDAVLT